MTGRWSGSGATAWATYWIPETGRETAAFELGSGVRDIAYDATGTWLLYTTRARELRWTGGGRSGSIPGRFVAAGW